jgi:hypothetical protein
MERGRPRSWLESRSTPRCRQFCAGVYRQRQGAGSHDPSNPPTTSRRCHGHPAWEATSGSAGPGAPHARRMEPHGARAHALPPCSPTPSRAQAHMGQHHLHGRITPACQPPRRARRAIVHAVWRSNLAAPARWLPTGDADRPGTRRRRHRQPRELAALHEAIRHRPDAAHHRKPLLVCALSNTQGRAPPSAGPHAPPRGDTGRIRAAAQRVGREPLESGPGAQWLRRERWPTWPQRRQQGTSMRRVLR